MLAGKCDAGKVLMRKNWRTTTRMGQSPEQLDKGVDFMATLYCQGKMTRATSCCRASWQLSTWRASRR
jgi:hypothetical protein